MWMFEGTCDALRLAVSSNGRSIESNDGRSTMDHRLESYAAEWFAQTTGAGVELVINSTAGMRAQIEVLEKIYAAEPRPDHLLSDILTRLRFIERAPTRSHVEVVAGFRLSENWISPFGLQIHLPPEMFDQVWSLCTLGVMTGRQWVVQLGNDEHQFPVTALDSTLVNSFVRGHEHFVGHEFRFQLREDGKVAAPIDSAPPADTK